MFAALVGEGHLAGALVDREEELRLEGAAFLAVHLAEHLHLHVFVELADGGVLEHVEHLLVLGRGVVHLVDAPLAAPLVAFGEALLGLGDELVALLHLNAHDAGDERVHRGVLRARGDGGRAGDDERRAGLVDEDRVHLVHNREVVAVLHHLVGLHGHAVVAQVVEAELAVGAVGDVAEVLLAALG